MKLDVDKEFLTKAILGSGIHSSIESHFFWSKFCYRYKGTDIRLWNRAELSLLTEEELLELYDFNINAWTN